MDTRALARADQIQALLREADGEAIPSVVIYMALGAHYTGWAYPETLELLNELRIRADVALDGVACCPHHARWTTPDDR